MFPIYSSEGVVLTGQRLPINCGNPGRGIPLHDIHFYYGTGTSQCVSQGRDLGMGYCVSGNYLSMVIWWILFG